MPVVTQGRREESGGFCSEGALVAGWELIVGLGGSGYTPLELACRSEAVVCHVCVDSLQSQQIPNA